MYLSLVMLARPNRPGPPAELYFEQSPHRLRPAQMVARTPDGRRPVRLHRRRPHRDRSRLRQRHDAGSPKPRADRISLALPLPKARQLSAATRSGWQFVRVGSGETLGIVFEQLKLPATLMHRLLDETSARKALTQLREGQELAFEIDGAGQLKTLRFDRDANSRVDLKVAGDSIVENVQLRPIERRVEIAAGTITRSLYADGARAGLSSGAINEMANIFKYDIDFVEDVRDGDNFQVVYEDLWRDGRRVGTGKVVGATFTNRGKRFTAFSYDQNGKTEYFDETGRPLKKVLMRIPIEFARLSSTFGMRKHPILGRMRAHKGVDYAARSGTPIMAAGDAKVSFVGWKSGYGRAVILDHGQGRSTLYGTCRPGARPRPDSGSARAAPSATSA